MASGEILQVLARTHFVTLCMANSSNQLVWLESGGGGGGEVGLVRLFKKSVNPIYGGLAYFLVSWGIIEDNIREDVLYIYDMCVYLLYIVKWMCLYIYAV